MRVVCFALSLLLASWFSVAYGQAPSSTPGEDPRIYKGVTLDEIQGLMQSAGLSAKRQEKEGDPSLVVSGGGAPWYAHLTNCKSGRCGDLRLVVGFDFTGRVSLLSAAEFNQTLANWSMAKVYVDDEGDPILVADVNTDGVTAANIRYSLKAFDAIIPCVLSAKLRDCALTKPMTALAEAAQEAAKPANIGKDKPVPDANIFSRLTPEQLETLLAEDGFNASAVIHGGDLATLLIPRKGYQWVASVQEIPGGKDHDGVILFEIDCPQCKDTGPNVNAYNQGERWLTAIQNDKRAFATMSLQLRGGITEASLRIMISTFDVMAREFKDKVAK